MKKSLIIFILIFNSLNLNSNIEKNTIENHASSQYLSQRLSLAKKIFFNTQSPFNNETVKTDKNKLKNIAQRSLTTMKRRCKFINKTCIDSILYKDKIEYIESIKSNLEFLIDLFSKNQDDQNISTNLLDDNFDFIKWHGHKKDAKIDSIKIPENKILLTKYTIYKTKGSYFKTKDHPHALYGIPLDEQELNNSEIKTKRNDLIRFKYNKQDIFKGALEKEENEKFVNPLVWLSKQSVEEALMQGTIVVEMPDKKIKVFNFTKTNHMPYERNKKPSEQPSYGYFKEVRNEGNSPDIFSKIHVIPEVTFAGDVQHIGFGQLIAIRYVNKNTKKPEIRLGIISDTGGAFRKNLYQLDYFVGIRNSKKEFFNSTRDIPEFVEAFILIRKKSAK